MRDAPRLSNVLPVLLLVLMVRADALSIEVSGFGPFGEAGARNGRTVTIGAGGTVFEIDLFLKIAAAESLQLSGGSLPAGLELTFEPLLADAQTDLFLRYSFTNRTGAPLAGLTLLSFFDAEIDERLNTFTNEYAEVAGALGSGAGDEGPDGFEVDEAGFASGDIFDHLLEGRLDNINSVTSSAPECVSMALSFELGSVEPGERVDLEMHISEDGDTTGPFSIVHRDSDPASSTAITYSGRVSRVLVAPAGSFRRGDADADASLEPADAEQLFAALFEGGPPAADCFGEASGDAADANDNEHFTIGDFLAVRSAAVAGSALPAPASACGEDPDDNRRGFDAVDPAYSVSAGDIEIDPPVGPTDRDVIVPILVTTAKPLKGLTLIFEYDATNLTPFDPAQGDFPSFQSGLGRTLVRGGGGALVLALWTERDEGVLVDAGPAAPQLVGTVHFHLADFAIVRPFGFAPELQVGGMLYRATLVDDTFADHHPRGAEGEFAFVRGNSNNDARVDISDPVFTLSYLFLGGPEPPCLDAADSDNNSALEITDPVHTLDFLFKGGREIPAPYPECGFDAGPPDLLGCTPCACPPYPQGDPCE